MVYIVSHTWRKRSGKKGEAKRIEVLSNCDEVELFVNGKSVGGKSGDFTWEARFNKGVNYLKAVGRKEKAAVKDEISLTYFIDE